MRIEVITVGVFREIIQQSRFYMDIDENSYPGATANTVMDILDACYDGRIKKELYLEDGSRNQWIRILLNGWDTRFLPENKLTLRDGDTLLISSVLVGG